MKAKKYTSSTWADLGKPVKKFATYTDEATTLPLTIEASTTNAIENYQVYGETVENLFDKNDLTEGAFKTSDGVVSSSIGAYSGYIQVKENTVYYVTNTVPLSKFYSFCAYDQNKSFLQYISLNTESGIVTMPEGCQYIIANLLIANKSTYMLTEGSTAPTRYVPFGTPDGVGEETENLVDVSFFTNNYTLDVDTGLPMPSQLVRICTISPINVNDLNTVTLSWSTEVVTRAMYSIFNNGTLISRIVNVRNNTAIDVSSADEMYICLYSDPLSISDVNYIMLVKGSTAPSTHIPHGYKIPILNTSGEQQSNYDLFIGDSKLYEDEYLDYQEQKVYKRTENISKGTETGSIWSNSSSVPADMRGTDADANNHTRTKSEEYYKFSTTQSYTISTPGITGTQVSVYTYDPDDYTSLADSAWTNLPYTFTPSNYNYRFVIRYSDNRTISNTNYPNLMITEGSTAPETFIPYLQPTDPPAPFPTLTTYLGENDIDVDTTVQPEKVAVTVAAWREKEGKEYNGGSWS